MNGTQRKTMPRIQLERIGDDVVITRGDAVDGHTSITMPLDQALILADWITAAAEDHDRVAMKEPHPSPEEDTETGEAGGCTRTVTGIPPLLRPVDFEHVVRERPSLCVGCRDLGICKELERAAVAAEERAGLRGPVVAIEDGEVRRA